MTKKTKADTLIPNTTFLDPKVSIYGEVVFGDFTKVGNHTKIEAEKNTILIGSNVRIDQRVRIASYGTENNTFICNNVRIKNDVQISNAYIEEYAMIGENVKVLENTFIGVNAVIGDNTIIAPNSRVEENQICEANAIYAGNPAKKIGRLDTAAFSIQKTFKSPMFSQVV